MKLIKLLLTDSPDGYYSTEVLSDNMSIDNKGYLICTNVIAARTGVQKYLGSEIGITDEKYKDEIFYLDRPSEELFSKSTIDSFNSAALTDGHPMTNGKRVDSKNSKYLSVGHVRNARKSDEKDADGNELLLVDIVVTDEYTINKVRNGKRQVSAGYSWDFEITDETKKELKITHILYNHLAIVDKGRAGNAMIVDGEDKVQELTLLTDDDINDIVELNFDEGGTNVAKNNDLLKGLEDRKHVKVSHDNKIYIIDGTDDKDVAKKHVIDYIKTKKTKKEEK